jgi:hypothetical protein
MSDGKDCRRERILDRKQELRRLLNGAPEARMQYVDHVDGSGIALFEQVCKTRFRGHCCQAEVCVLCERQRAKHMVQNQKPELFAMGWKGRIV